MPGYRVDEWDLIFSQGSNFALCYHTHAGSGAYPTSIHNVPGQNTQSVKLYFNVLKTWHLIKCVYICTQLYLHINACVYACTCKHACMHAHAHACTHTHTHTHTHTELNLVVMSRKGLHNLCCYKRMSFYSNEEYDNDRNWLLWHYIWCYIQGII